MMLLIRFTIILSSTLFANSSFPQVFDQNPGMVLDCLASERGIKIGILSIQSPDFTAILIDEDGKNVVISDEGTFCGVRTPQSVINTACRPSLVKSEDGFWGSMNCVRFSTQPVYGPGASSPESFFDIDLITKQGQFNCNYPSLYRNRAIRLKNCTF